MNTLVFAKSAKKNGIVTDSAGHIYIYKNGKVRTGYFKYKGKTYYGHKTSTKKYPRGSVTCGEMRIKNGKWYAFSYKGARYDKDTYHNGRLQLDIRSRNHTVRYVYMTARTQLGKRYSTKHKRWQEIGDDGKWHDMPGMQVIPYGWVDDQR